MDLKQLIEEKREHLQRYSNSSGSEGEIAIIKDMDQWLGRPKGEELKILLHALSKKGIDIKRSSFDAIFHPSIHEIDLKSIDEVMSIIDDINFIEIKTANQKRVKEDFGGFFFAITENEISASQQLGKRHIVVLYNKRTGNIMFTSVQQIVKKSKSTNWQVSVQL